METAMFNQIEDICDSFDSDRLKLEFLKSIKKLVSEKIDDLICNENGTKYNTAFRANIMRNIHSANPDISSYAAYNKYADIRQEIISKLGVSYNTAMLTKDEYEKCLTLLENYSNYKVGA